MLVIQVPSSTARSPEAAITMVAGVTVKVALSGSRPASICSR